MDNSKYSKRGGRGNFNSRPLSEKEKNPEELKSAPIFYASYVDTTEVAAILLAKLHVVFIEQPEIALAFGTLPADLDVTQIGSVLDELFDPSLLNGFMDSEFGQGLVLGSYMQYMFVQMQQEQEQEVLEAFDEQE